MLCRIGRRDRVHRPLCMTNANQHMLAELFQHLVDNSPSQRAGSDFPPLKSSQDGMAVIHRSLSDIKDLCPEDVDRRSTWINNIELIYSTNTSGICWKEQNKTIPGILEREITQYDAVLQGRTFPIIDCVVPFSSIFACSS